MKLIPASHEDLLQDEKRALVYLATVMPDGSPQVTPVWFDIDAEHILINTATGRVKDKNMSKRPQIALCIADPNDPYRYLQVRGKVVERTTDGAEDHIDQLNLKYNGNPHYPRHDPKHPRVIYKIQPQSVDAHT